MKVLIVDDHQLFAEAVRAALIMKGFDVVGVVTTGTQAFTVTRELRPELVLLDIALPDQDGLEVGQRILRDFPETKVVAVTAMSDPQVAREAARIGFHGYLTKHASIVELLRSVRAVGEGEVIMPPRVSREQAQLSRQERQALVLGSLLTFRERQVLSLLVRGTNGQEIADELTMSSNTVRSHVHSILNKLGAHSRLEAAALAVRYGIVEVSSKSRPAL